MESSISAGIFAEIEKCTDSEKFFDFIMPTDLNKPTSFYSSEDEINDIDIDD